MKTTRLEIPNELSMAALQEFLRQQGLQMYLLGGSERHRDYAARPAAPTKGEEHVQ